MKILECDKVVVNSGSMTAYLEEDPVAMLSENRLIIFKKPEHASWDWAIRQVLEQGERTMTEKLVCPHCCAQIEFDDSERQWICCGTGEPIRWIPLDDPITSRVRKLADEINALREEYNLSFDEVMQILRLSSW